MNISGQQWNTALSVFFVTYSLGAVPANIALQKFGPRIWLPTMMLSVSIILVCASLQSTFGGWAAFRVLLGLVEAGVFPGCSAVLTTWYSPHEVHSRMTIFYTGASAAGGFSGLLAYAIGQLDGTWGYKGWRWIFCLEGNGLYFTDGEAATNLISSGIFSAVLSIAAFWIIHDTPANVGWLTAEEKRYLALRHKFSAGGETGVAEKEDFSWDAVGKVYRSFHVYALVLMEFTLCVVVYGVSFVLPTMYAPISVWTIRQDMLIVRIVSKT
jgi:MFS family permease